MIPFKDAIRTRKFVLTADLALSRATGARQVEEQARVLGPVVDGIQVPDSHDGRLQMSPQQRPFCCWGRAWIPSCMSPGAIATA